MRRAKGLDLDVSTKGESSVLRRIQTATGSRRDLPRAGLRLGMGDDAALWRPSEGHEAILTCDWFLEGIHFLRDKHPPDSVGWKCLTRALSDIAAMGGVPRSFLLSLALPVSHLGKWLDEFLEGLRRASVQFQCRLAGGDTTRHRRVLISVTVAGEVRAGRAIPRSGARPRDVVFVTGRLGEAEAGLRFLRRTRGAIDRRDPKLRKHLYPEPRLAVAQWLVEKRLPSAMMDLSDGLSTDLPRLCAASGVGARVYAGQIPTLPAPLPSGLGRDHPLDLALHGGDDYELLFTMPREKAKLLPESLRGIPVTAIGEITAVREIVVSDAGRGEKALRAAGWDPFASARNV